MELSRRSLFGASATAITFLPGITRASRFQSAKRSLKYQCLMNLENFFSSGGPYQHWQISSARKINEVLLDRYGSQIFGPVAMRGPADLINEQPILAKTRAFKAKYNLELRQDMMAISGLDANQELAVIMAEEIAAEYIQYQRDLQLGYRIYPYIPAIPVHYVDLDSFQPCVGFKARYGTAI